jgi:heme/copper-type cytochrome/quinol oxidase subunit 2
MSGRALVASSAAISLILGLWPSPRLQATGPGVRTGQQTREFHVVARHDAFSPSRLEVNDGDIVRISLTTEDIPRTLTIDAYRVSMRARPGRGAIIEFVADTSGTHPFYCNLTTEDGCREMRGEMVVR